MRVTCFAIVAVVALAAANPDGDRAALDRVRAANAALTRNDLPAALAHLVAAEEQTADPGLVAFNRGAVAFRMKNWRDAEAHFTRALDDRECPPERRAKALYNRGVCLIRRGGLAEYRTAIDSFERCLALPATDPPLAADARHNLELAKLLWIEARARDQKKPTPNEPPEAPPDPPPQPEVKPPEQGPGDEQPGTNPAERNPAEIDPTVSKTKAGQEPKKTDRQAPGKGTLPVVVNGEQLPPRTQDEARAFLKQEAVRLAKDRRGLAELIAPPERPNVKDW